MSIKDCQSLINSDLSLLKENADQAAALLKAMSNPNRLIILCSLFDTEMSVSEMNAVIPLSQSALSQHLASLRKSNLVKTRRESQTIFYSINGDASSRVITVLKDVYCPTQ